MINAHLAKITYKDNWSFQCLDDPFEGQKIRIVIEGLPDSYNPGSTIDLGVESFLPPCRDTGQLEDFLFWRIQRIEIHEAMEFFRVNGELVWDPHELEPELVASRLE
jgi:hypothetical protein